MSLDRLLVLLLSLAGGVGCILPMAHLSSRQYPLDLTVSALTRGDALIVLPMLLLCVVTALRGARARPLDRAGKRRVTFGAALASVVMLLAYYELAVKISHIKSEIMVGMWLPMGASLLLVPVVWILGRGAPDSDPRDADADDA